MGYACPVCESPQADRRHLANHLAFTAMIHSGDHEQWLDDHAPDWEEAGEDDLAARIAGDVREVSFPPESVGNDHDHADHDHDHDVDEAVGRSIDTREKGHGRTADIVPPVGSGGTADEASVEAVLAKARQLTERTARSGATEGENRERSDTPNDDKASASDRNGSEGAENGNDE